jgi:hypothetical protein
LSNERADRWENRTQQDGFIQGYRARLLYRIATLFRHLQSKRNKEEQTSSWNKVQVNRSEMERGWFKIEAKRGLEWRGRANVQQPVDLVVLAFEKESGIWVVENGVKRSQCCNCAWQKWVCSHFIIVSGVFQIQPSNSLISLLKI